RVRTTVGSVLWLHPSHRGRCSYNQHAPTVGAPAPGANNGRLGVSASPFAPGAVLLQSARASCVGAPAPGANNGRLGALASPFAPRAVLLHSARAIRRSPRPGCE